MEWWKENNVPANKTVLKGWNKWPKPDDSGLILEQDATGVIVGASYA
jgi:Zn ribbon nucleic-acid-binding protein